ncbi:MAG: hypothetical protein WBA74_04795 [Cyclobacteriaceae bacterium]
MKRKFLLTMSLAVAAILILMSASLIMTGKEPVSENVGEVVKVRNFVTCPNGPVTVQGCITEDDGCFSIETINGRTISIGIVGQGVGAGDEVSLTGNWQTDADCAPCVLNATSVTDLGDCN